MIEVHLDRDNENWLASMRKNKGGGKTSSLRGRLVRLAYQKPELREALLALIKTGRTNSPGTK